MGRITVLLVVGMLIVDWSWAGERGPMKMSGRMLTQQVTIEQMEAAIQSHLRGRINEQIAEVAVRMLEPQEPVSVAAGTLGIHVTSAGSAEGYARQSFDLAISVNGRPAQTIRATAEVTALADMVAVTRLVKQDEVIGRDDVAVVRMRIARPLQDFVVDIDEAVGKRAIKPIRPQTPIPMSFIGQPYLVRKGDRVTIEAKRGGLLIQATGITKAMGQMGQFLTVTNQDSGKDVRAQVVGPGLVRVDF